MSNNPLAPVIPSTLYAIAQLVTTRLTDQPVVSFPL